MVDRLSPEYFLKPDMFAIWPINAKIIKEIESRKRSAYGHGAVLGNVISEKRLSEIAANFDEIFDSVRPPTPPPSKSPVSFSYPELNRK